MKRDGAKAGALVSRKTQLVSPRFTFRFTPFCYRSAYGSRTRAPALRGLMPSLVCISSLLLCCYFYRFSRFLDRARIVPMWSVLAISLVVLLAILYLVSGGRVAFSISGGSTFSVDQDATLGYAFTVGSPISVTRLGLFDEGSDGLNGVYYVDIMTSDGQAKAHAKIPAGTGATFINGFRYVSITPVLLYPGTYKIFANYNKDFVDATITSAVITSASGVTYDGSVSDTGWTFPSGNHFGLSNGYFGPNFRFTPQ
jgi:hypothetical protein